jgi:hypothetical protein
MSGQGGIVMTHLGLLDLTKPVRAVLPLEFNLPRAVCTDAGPWGALGKDRVAAGLWAAAAPVG